MFAVGRHDGENFHAVIPLAFLFDHFLEGAVGAVLHYSHGAPGSTRAFRIRGQDRSDHLVAVIEPRRAAMDFTDKRPRSAAYDAQTQPPAKFGHDRVDFQVLHGSYTIKRACR